MAKSYNQKMKILFLLQLFENSGENDIFPMQKIVELLAEEGIRAERKSIYNDLEVLRQYGLDIRYRKERPSGYHIVKEKSDGSKTNLETEKPIIEAPITETPAEERKAGFFIPMDENGEEKTMKLLCDEVGREEITRYFGDGCSWKEKEFGKYQTSLKIIAGPAFYGWITAMEKHIKMQKPKKEAAAYRDYLKALAKEYKGIERQ